MPTASEAAGRKNASQYNCGESQETSTWTTHGLRRKAKPGRVHNSYLERFQELKQRKKSRTDLLQGTHDNTEPGNDENDGSKEAMTEDTDRGSQASGKPASEGRSHRKSRLCAIL